MPKAIDLTDRRFGLWKVIRRATKEETPANATKAFWWCQCQCENKTERAVNGQSLIRGISTNCGCDRHGNLIDETNNVYGELKVLRLATDEEIKKYGYLIDDYGRAQWLCECKCGNLVVRSGHTLRQGLIKTCGHTLDVIDETDKEYGDWKVKHRATYTDFKAFGREYMTGGFWICECKCGKTGLVSGTALRSGTSTGCGHKQVIDETNKEYGNWKVIRRATPEEEIIIGGHVAYWLCECKCENKTRKFISGHLLRNGQSTGCGCNRGKTRRGDISRTQEQIELLENADKLKEALIEFEKKHGIKPRSLNIATMLGFDTTSGALDAIRKRGLEQYISLCDVGVSGLETELINRLQLRKDEYILNDRSILNGKEIDIYIPSIKLGIEIDGNYWHSDAYKDKNYHYEKSMLAKKVGIRLIHLYEYEWNSLRVQEIIVGMLNGMLHGTEVIYARKCDIRKIDIDTEMKFNNKYHLQGNAGSRIAYGLYYNDELVSLMSFGSPRFDRLADYELIRYTARYDTTVIGGAERLLKAFTDTHKGSIISYCDISKFSGAVYNKLGFEFESITEPSYVWCKGGSDDVLKRYQCQKHILIKKGWGTEDETENQIMRKHGYNKLYDCGNYKFVLKT